MTHPPPERLQSYLREDADVTLRLLVEAHLFLCASCAARVAEYQRMSGRLPEATLHDELDLPPFERLWTAVTRARMTLGSREAAVLPPSLLATIPHPSLWRWITLWPERVKLARLIRDVDTGGALYVCHFAPGSTFPRHRHAGLEENVILAGGYQNGDLRVEVGDWVIGEPGSEEKSRAEDEECWCLSRVEPPGIRFAGWRRWAAPFFCH